MQAGRQSRGGHAMSTGTRTPTHGLQEAEDAAPRVLRPVLLLLAAGRQEHEDGRTSVPGTGWRADPTHGLCWDQPCCRATDAILRPPDSPSLVIVLPSNTLQLSLL